MTQVAKSIKGETSILKKKKPLSSVEFKSLEIKLMTLPRFASLME